MTTKQARYMLHQTVVIREGVLGTVRKFNEFGFYVDWENGQRGWIAYDKAADIKVY